MRSAIGLHPLLWTGRGRRFRMAAIRAARPRRRARIMQLVAAPAWISLLNAPHGTGSLGLVRVCTPPTNRTLVPREEAKVPGVGLAGVGLCRQMELIPIGGHDGSCRRDTHWCRPCRPCSSGAHLCGGSGLVHHAFLLTSIPRRPTHIHEGILIKALHTCGTP
jgi:hypothetical protein